MKEARTQSLSAILLLFLALHAIASVAIAQLRVYPVGDSITWGTTAPGGYRSPLYQKLTKAGYDVDMVGSVKDFSDKVLRDAGEEHHDGHSGWTILQIDQQIERWLRLFEAPDVILIHIGTNDFRNGTSNTRAIDQLDNLMTKIALATPTSYMIVTNLLERGGSANTHIQADFNPFVEEKITGQVALGRKVSFLDMRSAVPLSDMPDQLHPNLAGLTKMADAYFGAIRLVVGPPSPFKVTSFSSSKNEGGRKVELTWNSRADRTYVIQTAGELNEWTDLPFSIPTDGTTTSRTVEIPADTADARYIRIREGLPSADLLSDTTVRWMVPMDASLGSTWTETATVAGGGFITGDGLGVGFETNPGVFDPFINTRVLDQMLSSNASIYLRYEFAVPATRKHTTLELGMRYDDGFVAYLNGIKIAERNAPEVAAWDSKATAGHSDSKAVDYEEINVSGFVEWLLPGQDNVLAIQGMNKTATGSDFLIMPRLTGEFEGE
jgi:lysophospholipase L1-like esterase